MKKNSKLNYANIYIIVVFVIAVIIIVFNFGNIKDYHYQMTTVTPFIMHDYDLTAFKGDKIKSYEDDKYYSRFGIDVSTYQNDIDFNHLVNNGVEFVYIRLGYRGYSEGKIYLDDRFETNYQKAKEAGLDVGVYFYSQAINDKEAIDEAYFVLQHIKHKDIDLEVVYDIEKAPSKSARTALLDNQTRTKCVVAFLEKIKEFGYRPMLYLNYDFAINCLDMEYLNSYPLWYAQYDPLPMIDLNFKVWQYTQKGKLEGIDTNVDFNIRLEEK